LQWFKGAIYKTPQFKYRYGLNLLSGGLFGILAVLIISWLAVLHHEDDEYYGADERYEGEKEPPSASIRVVEPANPNSNAGD
jgi:hypothetical protein